MSKSFWNLLEDTAEPGELEKLSPFLKQKLHTLSKELALILSISTAAARSEILSQLRAEVFSHLRELEEAVQREFEEAAQNAIPRIEGESRPGVPVEMGSGCGTIQPEILKWARQQLNEEDTVAGLREIRETGGVELDDFLQDLEREAMPND